jgi:hypothetical protein
MKKAGLTSEDMGRAGEEKRDWVAVQQRTFTRWVNQQLTRRGGQVTDLLQDLPDGIHLIHLVEELSGALLKGYAPLPPRLPLTQRHAQSGDRLASWAWPWTVSLVL